MNPDDPISTFEDLDSFERPEDREESARRSHRREAVLGIGLLLILAFFAFSQWRDTQAKQDAYHSGEQAVSAYDWHAARSAFSSIPGYKDANERAAEAAQMITYTMAFSGSIAVRTEGDPPGLYYNGKGGWHNLPGSDLQSRVLAICPSGDIAYDAPWFAVGEATPTPATGRLPARRILVSTRLGTPVARLSIDANPYDQFLCSNRGLWAAHSTDIVSANGDTHAAAPHLLVQYQDFTAREPISPVLPDPSWIISAIMPDGEHLLLADTSRAASPPLNWHTRLYLSAVDGSNPDLLGEFSGAPGPGPYESVGNNLLFPMYLPLDNQGGYRNSIVLIGHGQPRELASADIQAETFDDHFAMQVVGINTGTRAGQALIYWPVTVRNYLKNAAGVITKEINSSYTAIRIVDTNDPSKVVDLQTRPLIFATHLLSIDKESGTIILGVNDLTLSTTTNMLVIDGKNTMRDLDLAISSRPGQASEAWVRKGRLVYSSGLVHLATQQGGGPFAYIFEALPLNQLPDTANPKTLSLVAVPGVLPAVGFPWRIGPDMFAYITPSGEVHGINYDGTGDRLLDHGIAVFSQYDTDAITGP
jgi:hypothetical protein